MKPIQIEKVILHDIKMDLIKPFVTSHSIVKERQLTIVEMIDQHGNTGWGECVAFISPWYTEETQRTCRLVMKDFLIPLLLTTPIDHPMVVSDLFRFVKRNHMAKAALECAVWDLFAKQQQVSLSRLIGGSQSKVAAGISIGMKNSPQEWLQAFSKAQEEGYGRVKIKISRETDLGLLEMIRESFPDLPLMVDANADFSLADMHYLKALDQFGLLMIEQPLASDSFCDYAELQAQLRTPICLDESIGSYSDAVDAVRTRACRVINVKVSRVGGLHEAIKISQLCAREGLDVWCGGMLESGIGRAYNIALASLADFTLPGDISNTANYWEQDITEPAVEVVHGMIHVPTEIGLGFQVNRARLEQVTSQREIFQS